MKGGGKTDAVDSGNQSDCSSSGLLSTKSIWFFLPSAFRWQSSKRLQKRRQRLDEYSSIAMQACIASQTLTWLGRENSDETLLHQSSSWLKNRTTCLFGLVHLTADHLHSSQHSTHSFVEKSSASSLWFCHPILWSKASSHTRLTKRDDTDESHPIEDESYNNIPEENCIIITQSFSQNNQRQSIESKNALGGRIHSSRSPQQCRSSCHSCRQPWRSPSSPSSSDSSPLAISSWDLQSSHHHHDQWIITSWVHGQRDFITSSRNDTGYSLRDDYSSQLE